MSDSFVVLRTAQPFAVGGISGMLASSVVHPIDLSKVRLQLFATMNPDLPKPSFATIIGTMIRKEGFTSIYAGLSASLLRQAVYGTARIGLHRSFSSELQRRNDGKALSFPVKILSGMASGSIAVCLGTPFDVALVRMQADSMKEKANRRGYKNVFDALARVFREEGISKLYSGLYPNILRGMSVNAGMLACFDQAKEFVGANVMHDPSIDQPSLPTQLLASMISGFTASFFSLPFDLLKSRLQDGNRYSGIVDAATKILRTEGVLAFWTGFGAYYMRTAPHAMIILMLSEPLTKLYSQTVLR